MTFLRDVNVLIALIEPTHLSHDIAHCWFENIGEESWATCPYFGTTFWLPPGVPGGGMTGIRLGVVGWMTGMRLTIGGGLMTPVSGMGCAGSMGLGFASPGGFIVG